MARDPKHGRLALAATAALILFGIGVGVGTAMGGGAGHRASVPPAVAAAGKSAAPQSQQQAMDAAVGYATVMAQLFPLTPDGARAVLAGDASDAYRATLVQAVDDVVVPLQQQMAVLAGQPMFRQSVLAAKLVSYTAGRARVSAWVMAVAGQTGVADNAVGSFSIVTVDVVFERGGWRLDRSDEQPGPSPQMTGAPTSVDVLVGRLAGYSDWRPQ
jgi:hypothetical protein